MSGCQSACHPAESKDWYQGRFFFSPHGDSYVVVNNSAGLSSRSTPVPSEPAFPNKSLAGWPCSDGGERGEKVGPISSIWRLSGGTETIVGDRRLFCVLVWKSKDTPQPRACYLHKENPLNRSLALFIYLFIFQPCNADKTQRSK